MVPPLSPAVSAVVPSSVHPVESGQDHASVLPPEVYRTCLQAFGYETLRPHQQAVLGEVFAGRDCLAVLPTGSGKSLCYALPALVRDGLVLVVSPLIALIRDQARRFALNGIPCAAFDSLQSADEKAQVWQHLARGELKLLIVSPERLARADFRARLKALPLQLVAIDEAHCVSHWGNHFRPDYRLIGHYLADFGAVQKLAVTATATRRVRDDIEQALRLRSPAQVWAEVARTNLRLKIVKTEKVAAHYTLLLQTVLHDAGSGIVYVQTRKQAREVHRLLVDAGIAAEVYHAGLPPASREAAQRAFMAGTARVVVATNSFGLGIDKADIRFVHHASLPASIEQYVQEIGRAGRDGLQAHCTLIYGSRDFHIQKFMIDKSFPDLTLLTEVLAAAREFIGGGVGESPLALTKHLRSVLAATEEELAAAFEVLCREGLLARLTGTGGYGDYSEVLIGDGYCEDEAAILRDYPLRKGESMAKLEAMKVYAAATSEQRRFLLDDYFRR